MELALQHTELYVFLCATYEGPLGRLGKVNILYVEQKACTNIKPFAASASFLIKIC